MGSNIDGPRTARSWLGAQRMWCALSAAMLVGMALSPAAAAQQLSGDASLARLSIMSGLGQTKMFPAFDPDVLRYDVAVPSGETAVTVSVAPDHSGAAMEVSSIRSAVLQLQPDPDTGDYTLELRADRQNFKLEIKVTAQDRVTENRYEVHLNVASSEEKGWRVYNDVPLNRLVDDPRLLSHYVRGLWADDSDDPRVLVTALRQDPVDQKLYAFNADDSSRRPADEFALSGSHGAGIWSDGTTLWAMDSDGYLRAYNLSDGSRIANSGFDVSPVDAGYDGDLNPVYYRDNAKPGGIWSDGETVWVVDQEDAKVYAYKLDPGRGCSHWRNLCRQADKEFDMSGGNDDPWGITALGDTWWVSDRQDRMLYAYNRSDGSRDSDKDFDLRTLNIANAQQLYYGLAATETIMYVSEFITNRVYSFNMPGVSGPVAPPLSSAPVTPAPVTPTTVTSAPVTPTTVTSAPVTSAPGVSSVPLPVGGSSGEGSGSSNSESDAAAPLSDAGVGGSEQESAINALHGLGVFAGTECQPNRLCPNDMLDRWIAAVWLVRLIDGDDPAPVDSSRFEDVSASLNWEDSMWFAPHVERLADLGITIGCSQDPPRFCSDANLARSQVATWLVRAFDIETAESQGFADALDTIHEANIDSAVAAGVMEGCSTDPKNFCLYGIVTKGEMAVFVDRARNVAAG